MSCSSSRSTYGCGSGPRRSRAAPGSLTSRAAESIRTPATPRSNQKRSTSSCSRRTAGWDQLRSGCSGAKRWRYHSPSSTRVQGEPPNSRRQSLGGSSPCSPRARRGSGRGPRSGLPGPAASAARNQTVLVGDVVGHDVDDRADPQFARLGDQLLGLGEGAEGRVDGPVVGHVVAAVGHRREVPGGEPQCVDAEFGEVGQPWRGRPPGRRCRRRRRRRSCGRTPGR